MCYLIEPSAPLRAQTQNHRDYLNGGVIHKKALQRPNNFIIITIIIEYILPTSFGSPKNQKSSRKTFTSALLPTPKPLTVWIITNWKILQEMGISDHLTCLLSNLYVGQEATARTALGTTDWLPMGKGVCQGCILLSCLFNLCRIYHAKCQAG